MSEPKPIPARKGIGAGQFIASPRPETRGRETVIIGFLVLFAVSAAIQWHVVSTHRIPIGSDQAVVGLMAKHILEGKGHPVFYWGATYAGSLEPHYVAGMFAVLGVSVPSYRIAMAVMLSALMLGIFLLTRKSFGPGAGLAALVYLCVPPFFFLYKGLTSDGAYDAVALLTLAIVALAFWIDGHRVGRSASRPAFLALGFLMGMAFWVMPHTAAVSAVILGWLLFRRQTSARAASLAFLLAGAVIGSSPWWLWNLRHGWASLKATELGIVGAGHAARNLAGLLSVSLASLEGGVVATPDPQSLLETFPLSGPLVIGAVIVLLIPSIVRAVRGDRRCALLLAVLSALFLTACFSQRLILTEPRYLFSYYVLSAPLLGLGLAALLANRRRALAIAAAAVLLSIHGTSIATSRVSFRNVDAEVTGSLRPLIAYLEAAGLNRVYANYWTAYRLGFESGERIIATPLPLDEFVRYKPYLDVVNAARNPAIVLLQPRNACFGDYLRERKIPFQRVQIGEFGVYSGLSPQALDPIRASRGLPLPDRAYRVGWKAVPGIPPLAAGASRPLEVTVRNAGPCVWPVSVHLGYHWWPVEQGLPAIYDGERGFPSGPLGFHESENLVVKLAAPPTPGRYRLELDLVNENVDWFSNRGGQTANVLVRVLPASVAGQPGRAR